MRKMWMMIRRTKEIEKKKEEIKEDIQKRGQGHKNVDWHQIESRSIYHNHLFTKVFFFFCY